MNCKDCCDESYPLKYAHYMYFDNQKPTWSCWSHLDTTRKWVGITNPAWGSNLSKELNDDENEK